MFDENPHNAKVSAEGETSSMANVLTAALSFMKNKIVTSDNDKIGIVLYGTRTAKNPLNFNSINVVLKLDTPDAQTIKLLQEKIATYRTDFGCCARDPQKSPLFEALWTCHQEFKSVEKQTYSKRIFLFTDEDCPGSAEDQAMAK